MSAASSTPNAVPRIGIIYPSDPLGHVPSGIDSFVRGFLKFSPADLSYTLLGATSDPAARPVGRALTLALGAGSAGCVADVAADSTTVPERAARARFLPLCTVDARGGRGAVPLVVRFMWALSRAASRGACSEFSVLDFHRIEPALLFSTDRRPRNVVLHQDMSIVRDPNSDILWRHAPAAYDWLEHRVLARMDRIYCVRESAVERYRRTWPAIGERTAFVPTWVDTAVFRPPRDPREAAETRAHRRAALGLEASTRLLTFVGRLDRQKDPTLLLAAFARRASADPLLHLVLIGDGVLRPLVTETLEREGLQKRVTLLGVRGAAEIADWLRASDAFVLSSAYEGMPIAVLEALACGAPVASTDVGEIRRVVRDGETGHLASARDPEGLADALRRVLEAPREGLAARCSLAVEPYSPQRVLAPMFEMHRTQAARDRA